MSLDERVEKLDVVTTDLARLVSQSRLKLGENEQRMISMGEKMDEGHKSIISALGSLKEMQSTHMARSDEKFSGQAKMLDRLVDKLDDTSQRLSANESLSQQLRSQSATQFEQIGDLEAEVAAITGGAPVGQAAAMQPSPSLIDSPNFKWVMIPIILILTGLFGLAGYNMTADARTLMGAPSGE